MDCYEDDFAWSFTPKRRWRVVVIGAGIAGLSAAIAVKRAGHDVLILEQVREITEVGAGIQMAPNASRILGRLGLLEEMMKYANVLTKNSLRRWQDDQELGNASLMPQIGEKYKAPLSVIHRGDLQRVLLEGAKAAGIEIRLGHRVVATEEAFEARVQLDNGEWVEGDVVIVADGIRSEIRRLVAQKYNIKDHSQPTGDAAYRVVISKEQMQGDEHSLNLLASNVGMRWMGPGGHVMAYPIKNNTVYNIVLVHPVKPEAELSESWTNLGSKAEMLDLYSSWNSTLLSLLSYVPSGEVVEWTLNSHSPLPSWIENKFALIGDSCHPMLPYVAQGAAQAIEDAGTLAVTLSLADDVPTALQVYEAVRKSRGEAIQNSAATTREALHLPDGPEQQKRDAAIRGPGRNPDLWADREWQDFMWGVDVMKDTLENWEEWRKKVQGVELEDLRATCSL